MRSIPRRVSLRAGLDTISFTDCFASSPARQAPRLPRKFLRLAGSITTHGDEDMVRLEHVRSWVHTTVGAPLAGIVFTPVSDSFEALVQEAVARLVELTSMQGWNGLTPLITGDDDLDLLFTAELTASGYVPHRVRAGQSRETFPAWSWIGHALDRSVMLESVRLTAELLRSDVLLEALHRAVVLEDPAVDRLAMCVTRRWLLSLQALAWLDDALSHEWNWVRDSDLATFAFAALRPSWPRPLAAVSHRSRDAKPALIAGPLWGTEACAIDALFVPSWETNVGMIWGLFAATPAIVRVGSPSYDESIWCRRGWELSEHLATRCDFLEGRLVIDTDLNDLDGVRELIDTAYGQHLSTVAAAGKLHHLVTTDFTAARFPPAREVLIVHRLPEIEVLALRAAGALRILQVMIGDHDAVNRLADLLVSGVQPDVPPPTTNPDGWEPYVAVFQALADALGMTREQSPVRLAHAPSEGERELDRVLMLGTQDFATTGYDVRDTMAAIEWLRNVLQWFIDEDFGDNIVVDVRGVSFDSWHGSIEHSHQRGVLAMFGQQPVWVLQGADQGCDTWQAVGERPILTEHVPEQFGWMMPVSLMSSWVLLYDGLSGLSFSDELQLALYRCIDPADYPKSNMLGPRDIFAMEITHRLRALLGEGFPLDGNGAQPMPGMATPSEE